MVRWLKTSWLVVALLMLMVLPSFAQTNSAVRGGLGGVVFDSTGAVMPNITVAITEPQGNYAVKTDAAGRFELAGVVPGSYKFTVEAAGFKKYVSDHNQIQVDHTANLDVQQDEPRDQHPWRHRAIRSAPMPAIRSTSAPARSR